MRLKNEVMVGIVVVVGVIIAVIGSFWLSGRTWGEEQRDVVAVFQQVGELREGNPVKYRGVQVGRITNITLGEEGAGVLVQMEVGPDVEIPVDGAVLLAPASLFGDWQASIVAQSNYPELVFTSGAPPEVLPGATLPDITELTAVGARIAGNLETLAERVELAFTEETAIKMRETVDNVQEISEQLTGFVDQQTSTYRDVSQNVLAAAQDVAQTSARAANVFTEVEAAFTEGGQVQEILRNAEQASVNLEQLSLRLETATAGVPTLLAQADTTVADLGLLARSASTLLDTLEPQVREVGPVIENAQRTLAVLEQAGLQLTEGNGTLGRLLEDPAIYEEMQATIAALRRILADIQANPARYIGEVRVF